MTTMTSRTPQRAVMWDIPEDIAVWRQRTGADRHDEVWEGVIHMSPWPTGRHQGLGGALYGWLLNHWQARGRGAVYFERNVARPGQPEWRKDFRCPDLLLIKPDRYARDLDTHLDGGPDVVVEIHTPGDESYDKLPFYFEIGVEEVWVVHRDTKVPEVFVRDARGFEPLQPDMTGWLASPATSVSMRAAMDEQANQKLALRLAGDPASECLLPPDLPR